MATTHDTGIACIPGCTTPAPDINPGFLARAIIAMPGEAANMSAHIGEANAMELTTNDGRVFDDGCAEGPISIGRVWITRWGGPGNLRLSGSTMTSSGGGSSDFEYEFDCPIDFMIRPSSYQAGAEHMIFFTGPDEFYRGTGSTVATGVDLPDNTVYRDNQGASNALWRARQTVRYRHGGNGGVTCNHSLWTTLYSPDRRPVRCVSHHKSNPCAVGQTPRWRPGCDTSTVAPNFFPDFGAGLPWELSEDSGVTWAAAPASATKATATVEHERRWRLQTTIPAAMSGWFKAEARGGAGHGHGTMFWDNSPMGDSWYAGNPTMGLNIGWASGWTEVAEGPHVFEWREGPRPAGTVTTPVIRPNYRAVKQPATDIDIVECMDLAGNVVTTVYQDDNDGSVHTVPAGHTVVDGLCERCP